MGWCIIKLKTHDMVEIIAEELEIDEYEASRLLGIILGTIIYGVCRDDVCYVGKLGCFHAQEHHSMKTLKHWHHRPVNRIIFRPSTSFKSCMKSLSQLWH